MSLGRVVSVSRFSLALVFPCYAWTSFSIEPPSIVRAPPQSLSHSEFRGPTPWVGHGNLREGGSEGGGSLRRRTVGKLGVVVWHAQRLAERERFLANST